MDAVGIVFRTDGGGVDGLDASGAYQAGAGPGGGPFPGETAGHPRPRNDGAGAGGIFGGKRKSPGGKLTGDFFCDFGSGGRTATGEISKSCNVSRSWLRLNGISVHCYRQKPILLGLYY